MFIRSLLNRVFGVVVGLFLTTNILFGEEQQIVSRKLINGKELITIRIPGGKPPANPPKQKNMLLEPIKRSKGVTTLSDVPTFNWNYGCTATSAGMMMGYYDRTGYGNMYTGPLNSGVCPLTNSSDQWGAPITYDGGVSYEGATCYQCPFVASKIGLDGRTEKGHVEDYWYQYNSPLDPYYNSWTEHSPKDCLADFMGTNQYYNNNNTDGSTLYSYYTSGAAYTPTTSTNCAGGIKSYVEYCGYTVTTCYNQLIYGYNGNTQGFTFSQFQSEIDAGRPVLIHVKGHTMLGFGYDSSNNLVYLKNTWSDTEGDYDTMTWGGSYSGMQHLAVTVIQLEGGGGGGSSITLTYPDGGENIAIGETVNITWTSSGVTGTYKVEVYKGTSVVASGTNLSGSSANWDSTGATAGTDYKVKVISEDDPSVYDEGSTFTLSINGEDTYNATIGSQINIDASEVSDVSTFNKKPKVYILVDGKYKTLKVLKTTYPTDNIDCEWKKKCTSGQYSLYLVPKDTGIKYDPNLVTADFNLEPPVITSGLATFTETIYTSKGTYYNTQLDLNGTYFGTKKPKVYYVDDNDGKTRRFKVETKNPMAGNEDNGSSSLTAICKKIPAGSSGVIYIETKIGQDTATLNTSATSTKSKVLKISR